MCTTPGSRPQLVVYFICDYILMLRPSDSIINASSNYTLFRFVWKVDSVVFTLS